MIKVKVEIAWKIFESGNVLQFSKTPLFSVCFSRENKNESIKDQGNFSFDAILKVFANFVSTRSKI